MFTFGKCQIQEWEMFMIFAFRSVLWDCYRILEW